MSNMSSRECQSCIDGLKTHIIRNQSNFLMGCMSVFCCQPSPERERLKAIRFVSKELIGLLQKQIDNINDTEENAKKNAEEKAGENVNPLAISVVSSPVSVKAIDFSAEFCRLLGAHSLAWGDFFSKESEAYMPGALEILLIDSSSEAPFVSRASVTSVNMSISPQE